MDLQVERNLEGDISHNVPDFCVEGGLSLVYCTIDLEQYKLVRGLLEHNFGEPLEQFQRPMMSPLQDPNIQVRLFLFNSIDKPVIYNVIQDNMKLLSRKCLLVD